MERIPPLCSFCRVRRCQLKGYSPSGNPMFRGACARCRREARVADGKPAYQGKKGKPGVPRCPSCGHQWKACPICGADLDHPSDRARSGPASTGQAGVDTPDPS